MFKRILYLHGIGSTGGGSTVEMLKKAFPNTDIFSPELPTMPKTAFNYITKIRKTYNPDLIIGTSLGGFYTMLISGVPKLLINPAMFASKDIVTAIGYGTHPYLRERQDKETSYTIDTAYINELTELENTYFNSWKDDEYVYETRAVFGTEDNIVSHINDFKTLFKESNMVVDVFGHRMTEEVFTRTVVPFINKIYTEVTSVKIHNFINY